jgi:HlyD family secretion protein
MSKKLILITVAIVAVGGAIAWYLLRAPALPAGFAGGNGRIEAREIDITAKYPGRLKQVLADEGDTVDAGQVVATIDTEPLEAQLRAARAKILESQDNLRTANAEVRVKQAATDYADKQYKRSKSLVKSGAISEAELEVDLAKADGARADLIGTQAQAVRAKSAIDAATAEAERLQAEISDNTLKAPVRARVESRMAEPGEVVGPGGKVLSTYDLSDVYMYVFLPTDVAGKVSLGSEARIVLDAMPNYPIRATVSYISPTAQFTPKTVETAEERHNLSFRIKLQLDKEKVRPYERYVKAGIPGMGYVRFNPNADWPANLQVKPPPFAPEPPTTTGNAATDSTTQSATTPAADAKK